MAKMLGKTTWWGFYCHCCTRPRSKRHQRQIEKRGVRNEIRREREGMRDAMEQTHA